MKKLLIVESPAKIKTIKKFLGDDFVIMSTMGHVKDLPTKKIGVSINNEVTIEYVPIKDKEKTIADICKAAQKADEIYLGTDPDREGEIIAWLIAEEIKKVAKKTAKMYRIVFNEITKEAILHAIEHPGTIDNEKVAAQQARRVLDRWVGYEVSPVLWRKLAPGLSAGRVQSVSLRLICDREKSIRDFRAEEYWSIEGVFKHDKDEITAALTHVGKKKLEITNQKAAELTQEAVKKESFIIDSITDKKRLKNPQPPFMTSTLQQAAYNRLGFSVKKTMQVAQRLYEGVPLEDANSPVALITYMRTDSLRLSDTAITQARSYIDKHFDKKYLPKSPVIFGKKSKSKAQDAHEAIRPINVSLTPEYVQKHVPADQAKLYQLIWQRFVSCQMESALYAQRQVVITGGKFIFKVTGSTLIFDGYLKVYGISDEDEDKDEKVKLPGNLEEKKDVDLKKINSKQHFTLPQPRYTEASLVKEMEKEGIGRPSTYATILNTICARAYTQLDAKKRFIPTELGMTVTELLVNNLPKIMDPKFTAHMEEDLDKIANGDIQRDTLLKEFYTTFQQDLEHFVGAAKESKKAALATGLQCPQCTTDDKGMLVIRFGKAGEFVGCSHYPECTFTSNFKRDEQGVLELVEAEKPQILAEQCPQCQKPLRQVRGKFGEFVACSGYPECTYIYREVAGFTCPLCKKGEVARKMWRGGKFWGCDNYPKCKFSVFDEIEETPCPQCQKMPFLIKKTSKKGVVTYTCFDKTCGYKKEAE
ncbi:MAG: type I DNA topoisomerase [Candidatus Dependentiae bacterium]|nr:type I DNA topoisomerase [Candidatus Dependentiae bacterium]